MSNLDELAANHPVKWTEWMLAEAEAELFQLAVETYGRELVAGYAIQDDSGCRCCGEDSWRYVLLGLGCERFCSWSGATKAEAMGAAVRGIRVYAAMQNESRAAAALRQAAAQRTES